MVQLNTLEDLSGQPITRQTLFDMWRNANLETLSTDDFSSDLLPLVSQASAPSEAPGKLWHSTTEDVLFVYVDVYQGTGVSLWLAIGPDRLETPCLAAEPLPAGAVVQLDQDRWVSRAKGADAVPRDEPRLLGLNQSGVHWPLNEGVSTTAASGAWVKVAFEGIAIGYHEGGGGVSESYYQFTQNKPVTVDPRFRGRLVAEDNGPGSTDFFHSIGISVLNNAGYSASNQPSGAHYLPVLLNHPRKTRGF